MPVLLDAGYRVITYDRRGFGRSSQPTEGYNYDTFAEDLHKLIAHLRLHDFTLVGFSMGGGEIARYFGRYGSNGVRKAVFIGAMPPFLLKTTIIPRAWTPRYSRGFRKLWLRIVRVFRGVLQELLQHRCAPGTRVSEEVVRASWNIAAAASATASLACVPTWHEDFRHDLASDRRANPGHSRRCRSHCPA